jgi:putative membrane protein
VSWGILFRREIRLTYKRIQDIHVTRNVIERWLGIGTVEIQTAAGASGAEMSLLGMREHEAVRDFLYRRMRGYAAVPGDAPGDTAGDAAGGDGEALRLLREVRDELRAAREVLAARTAGSRSPRPDGGA